MEQDKKYTFEERFEMLMQSLEKSNVDREKSSAEFDKRLEKMAAENEKHIQEMRKNIRGISLSNGMMAEEFIFNSLEKDKTFSGIKFDFIRKNVPIVSEDYQTKTELDVLMVNGDSVAIVETKYKVEKDDIIDLINEKLAYFREYFSEFSKHKVVLGIGGMSFLKDAKTFAKKKGIGIIKIDNDKVEFHTENIKIY